MSSDTVDGADEVTVLGYLETLRATFLTKFILIAAHSDRRGSRECIATKCLSADLLATARQMFADHEGVFDSLEGGSPELLLNLKDDLVTSAILGCWSVFEHVVKDLQNPNHAHEQEKTSPNYDRRSFALSANEKSDLGFVEYLRHAIVHYNGAYYAERKLDHEYRGTRFCSVGHVGEKIIISPEVAYAILNDVDRLIRKAWSSHRKYRRADDATT